MKRRAILKLLAAGVISGCTAPYIQTASKTNPGNTNTGKINQENSPQLVLPESGIKQVVIHTPDENIKDNLDKVRHFDHDFTDDIVISEKQQSVLRSTVNRIACVQSFVGHANFNLLNFDDMLKYARTYSAVGAFTQQEKEFIDQIFAANARDYGFGGDKLVSDITASIKKSDTVKIPRSGNYLFKGDAQNLYNKLRKDVGESLVLTSGIRGVVKQIYLFLAKVVISDGNLSRASRSLAPPGHSYHAVGDFDVGKRNFGAANFSARFADTDEYRKLVDLGYIELRYTTDNTLGVRYEPWHIKVV